MVALWLTAKRREPAQGFIEFALMVVVLVAVASIGLAVLGTDLSTLFGDLGAKRGEQIGQRSGIAVQAI